MNKDDLKNLKAFIDGYNKLVKETGFHAVDAYAQCPMVEKTIPPFLGFNFSTDEHGKYEIPFNSVNYRREGEEGKVVWDNYAFNFETGEFDIFLGKYTTGEKGKYIRIDEEGAV